MTTQKYRRLKKGEKIRPFDQFYNGANEWIDTNAHYVGTMIGSPVTGDLKYRRPIEKPKAERPVLWVCEIKMNGKWEPSCWVGLKESDCRLQMHNFKAEDPADDIRMVLYGRIK